MADAATGAAGATADALCVFPKAMLSLGERCEHAGRRALAEQLVVTCSAPAAHAACSELAHLVRERARFALRLNASGAPLTHLQALRLQCGALAALRSSLDAAPDDVHRIVALAQERHGALADLPWREIVPALAAWQPARRRPSRP